MTLFILFAALVLFVWYMSSRNQAQKSLTRGDGESSKKLEAAAVARKVIFPPYFGWLVVLVVIAFNIFMYDVAVGVGVGFFNLTLVIALLVSFPRQKRNAGIHALALLSIAAGFGIGWRANGFVQSINAVTVIGVNLLLVVLRSLEHIQWVGLWLLKYILLMVPLTAAQIGAVLTRSQKSETANKSSFFSVAKTVFLTLIVVAFFIAILSQADPIFAQLVGRIRDEAIGRTFVSLFITFAMATLLSLVISPKKDEKIELSFFNVRDVLVPAIAVVVLFGVFLVVQARYLFATQVDLSAFDLTYAEYVRKGFEELLWAAFFGSLFVYFIAFKQRLLEAGKSVFQLKVVGSLFIFELLLVLGSALKRDLMYVDAYGLSRVRLIGGVFLIWLAGVLLTLLVFVLKKSLRESRVLTSLLVLSVMVVGVLNVMNIDEVIARAKPAQAGGRDYYYINILSEDAHQSWKESLSTLESQVSVLTAKETLNETEVRELARVKLALVALKEKRNRLETKYGSEENAKTIFYNNGYSGAYNFDGKQELPVSLIQQRRWPALNISQYQAYMFMQQHRQDFYDKVDYLLATIDGYERRAKVDLYDEEYNLIYNYDQPFLDGRLEYYPTRKFDPEVDGTISR